MAFEFALLFAAVWAVFVLAAPGASADEVPGVPLPTPSAPAVVQQSTTAANSTTSGTSTDSSTVKAVRTGTAVPPPPPAATPQPVATAPATAKPATTEPATVKPATTEPATVKPAATATPATVKPAVTVKPATTATPATVKPATTPTPATVKPATTAKPVLTAAPATVKPATTEPATTTQQKPSGSPEPVRPLTSVAPSPPSPASAPVAPVVSRRIAVGPAAADGSPSVLLTPNLISSRRAAAPAGATDVTTAGQAPLPTPPGAAGAAAPRNAVGSEQGSKASWPPRGNDKAPAAPLPGDPGVSPPALLTAMASEQTAPRSPSTGQLALAVLVVLAIIGPRLTGRVRAQRTHWRVEDFVVARDHPG